MQQDSVKLTNRCYLQEFGELHPLQQNEEKCLPHQPHKTSLFPVLDPRQDLDASENKRTLNPETKQCL